MRFTCETDTITCWLPARTSKPCIIRWDRGRRICRPILSLPFSCRDTEPYKWWTVSWSRVTAPEGTDCEKLISIVISLPVECALNPIWGLWSISCADLFMKNKTSAICIWTSSSSGSANFSRTSWLISTVSPEISKWIRSLCAPAISSIAARKRATKKLNGNDRSKNASFRILLAWLTCCATIDLRCMSACRKWVVASATSVIASVSEYVNTFVSKKRSISISSHKAASWINNGWVRTTFFICGTWLVRIEATCKIRAISEEGG